MSELLIVVAVLGLLGVATARAAGRRYGHVLAGEVIDDVLGRAGGARDPEAVIRCVAGGLAAAVGATRAEALFVTPPNKAVARVSLEGDHLSTIETPAPDELRELVTSWLSVDPRPIDLRDGDAHPLRPWLAQLEVGDAIVIPLMDPEPLGVLVLGNRQGGPSGAIALDGPSQRRVAVDATAALLDARRRELIARMPAEWFVDSTARRLEALPEAGTLARRLEIAEADREAVALLSLRVHAVDGVAEVGPVADVVADRLMRTVRRTDLVARVEADRVVVVLADLAESDIAIRACRRLVDRAHVPVLHDGVVVRPEVSAGVVLWDGHTSAHAIRAELDAAEAAATADPMHALHLRSSEDQRRGLAA